MSEQINIERVLNNAKSLLHLDRTDSLVPHGLGNMGRDLMTALVEVVESLEAQLQECRKDAERYRWLRNQNWHSGAIAVVAEPKANVKLGAYCPSIELLDAFIDAAMSQEKAE